MSKSIENTNEIHATWYFDDLIRLGYLIKYVRESETFICRPKLTYSFHEVLPTKLKEREGSLFSEITYTPDYKLFWTEKARYIFFEEEFTTIRPRFKYGRPLFLAYKEDDNLVTRIDVKPTSNVSKKGGKVSSSGTFGLKQRMIYDAYGIYIHKFIPVPMAGTGIKVAIFPNSFTPSRYLWTDGRTQLRTIHFPIITVEEFVNKRIKEMENFDEIRGK